MAKLMEYLGVAMMLLVSISTLTNVSRQIITLIRANDENSRLEKRLEGLEVDNRKLREKVRVASESGYVEGLKRELMGVGSKDDYWILLPEGMVDKEKEAAEGEQTMTKLERWLQMFTD